jgi:hypothetical protein
MKTFLNDVKNVDRGSGPSFELGLVCFFLTLFGRRGRRLVWMFDFFLNEPPGLVIFVVALLRLPIRRHAFDQLLCHLHLSLPTAFSAASPSIKAVLSRDARNPVFMFRCASAFACSD